MPTRLAALASLVMCPRCRAQAWTYQEQGADGLLRCESCQTLYAFRDGVLDLGSVNEDAIVVQERAGVLRTERDAELGGINEEFEDLSRAEGALRGAILALPYGDGSRYYAEPGYFRNVQETVPAFDFLLKNLDPRPGERLLDLGADLTWSTHQMARRGLDCSAVDINHHLAVGRLFEAHSGVVYHRVRANMRDVPFRDGTFDIVLAMNALHHAERLEPVAANIARMLRPAGRIGFSEPYCATEAEKAAFGRAQIDAGISEQTYLLREWHDVFVSAGFRLITSRVSDSFAAVYEQAAGGDRDLFAGFYAGRLDVLEAPGAVAPGATFGVTIAIENHSNAVWTTISQFPVRASYHLSRRRGTGDELLTFDNVRTRLPSEIAPGQRVTMTVDVVAPIETGEYVADIDLVQEFVAWFATKGLGRHTVSFRVT